MSKVIIGIHGLGNKPEKDILEKWWLQAICEGLRKVNRFNFEPKFKLVYWADILNKKPLSELIDDAENPFFLDEPYSPSNLNPKQEQHSKRKKFLGFLEDQLDKIFLNDDLSANFNFISDLIFKKYFLELDVYYAKQPPVNDKSFKSVKEIIRNRLSAELKNHKGDDILLIAHSMGSIIAYDVCNFSVPEIKIDTLVTMGSPLGIPIILSKIAEEQKLIDPEIKKLKSPPNISKNWFNFADVEDNVALNYNLADDFESNEAGVKVIDIVVANDYMVRGERNPHKSYGYLRAPEFSNILADFLKRDAGKFTLWLRKKLYEFKNIFQKIINLLASKFRRK
ncbi:MAG: hypothetical protein OQJ81_02235 [Melioribacteraceae bacterium]|nr:hypothetical protein [Melioribacteraceae bacterium]